MKNTKKIDNFSKQVAEIKANLEAANFLKSLEAAGFVAATITEGKPFYYGKVY